VLDVHVCCYSIEVWKNGEPFYRRPLLARVSGRQAGGGFSTLAGQNMDEWGKASVLMWISSWPL